MSNQRLMLTFVVALFASAALPTSAADPTPQSLPRPVELWSNGAPGATGDSDEDKPAVYAYLPAADQNTGAAVLVCPGGGFTTRCVDFEGVLVAQWLKSHGVAGIILRYRIRPLYAMKDSLLDAQRGIQYVRAHADELRVDPNRIGIIGFSAGAELAASASMRTLPAKADASDPIDRQPSRPDFLVLAYGSAPMPRNSDDAQSKTAPPPPTFLFCTAEDAGHLGGMLNLYSSLRAARVPVEAHFFANGEHGVGFAQGDPVLGAWPDLMFNWMRAGGFLTARPRVALRGMVKLDGEPLARGSVILTPVDAGPRAPPAVGYVFNTGPTRGEFVVRKNLGPVPGRYRVEVRQDATRWLSNARDPMQLAVREKMRAGTFTDEDRRAWNEATRKRDLSPSIEGQRVYRRKRPNDAEELTVEIKAGQENRVDVEVFSR
jgi:acetyl esterase/lipase